jgi:hypothetical protein
MTNELLFSYGTLQREKVQLDLFGRVLNGAADSLNGFKSTVIEIEDPKFLAKGDGKFQRIATRTNNSSDSIEGMVFEVTMEELAHADKYEPPNYKREKVKLESGKIAWMYVAIETE